MQIKNLKVFCDVVGRHSFSKAAADNDMTQSGASQAVQQLEEFLQVKLIDRSKRPFVLTAEGSAFHAGCSQIVRQFESLAEEVRSLGQEISGRATVASIYSIGLSYVPEIQKQFKDKYPKAEVRFLHEHPDEIYRMVEQGIADFGLVSFPQQSRTIVTKHWCEEPMLLVATESHRLASRKLVTPEDLGLEALVAFAPNLRIRHEIDRYLRQLGISMQIIAEFDNIDSIKHGLTVNAGVAFLPEPTVREEIAAGRLVALQCPWLKLNRPLGIIQRKNSTLGRTARGLLELMQQLANASGDEIACIEACDTDLMSAKRTFDEPVSADAAHAGASESSKRPKHREQDRAAVAS